MKRLALGLILSLTALTAFSAENEKMDLSDHNSVIIKLEAILPNLVDDAKKQNVIQMRLADLYAERARIYDINAGEKNCTDCKEAKQDRKRAVQLYEGAIRKADEEVQKKSYPQLAHLYLMNDQLDKANGVYKTVLKDNKLRSMHPKAHLGLADVAFTEAKYKVALAEYQLAKKGATKEDQSYITYRMAWSKLNSGENETALALIQVAVRQADSASQKAFRKDLMRDYATILARNDFKAKDVHAYINASPEADRAENLKFLGNESERLGNKRGALMIWAQFTRESEDDSADVLFKFAQNYYDIDQPLKALTYLEKTVKAVNREKCEDENCKPVIKNFRSFLVNWNKKEKTEPSKNLTKAYSLYFEVAPEDYEALIWAGQVAQAQNNSIAAYGFYDRAAVVAHKIGKTADAEKTSIVAIEIAELTNRTELKIKALNRYLELNPKGARRNLMKYQLAYIAYQSKKYDDAASEFKSLALDESWSDTSLRIKAADLNLDALSILKQESKVRSNALEFAKTIKGQKVHFQEIARKVTINILTRLVTAPDSSRSEIRSEIENLRAYPIAHLGNKDKIAHTKNLMLAAEKVGDIATVETQSQQLLRLRDITPADVEFANRSLLWVAELKLDFKKAYSIALQMKGSDKKGVERDLRLGLLAELAGVNPEGHFNDYIRRSNNVRKSNELRVKMIRRSSNKWAKLNSMLRQLRVTPDILASITLEIHLSEPNFKQVGNMLAIRGVSRSPEGFYLAKLQQRENYKQFRANIGRQQLDARSDRSLQRSMKARIGLLDQLKRRYDSAVNLGDIPLQAMILSTIETENRRFYRQIQALPAPRGLSAKERETYRGLIDQQSKPFLETADQAKENIEKSVADNDKAMKELEKALQSPDTLQRRLATNELRTLRPYMSAGQVSDFKDVLADNQVSNREIENIRKEIRINPLNTSVLKELREMEARRANGPLIAYLDERIEQLKTDSRR